MMSCRTIHALTVGCAVAAALLASPAKSQGACRLWDCLFGASPASATTYAPPYQPAVAAPVYAAPPCSPCPTVVSPSCSPCTTVVVPSCTPCVPQACQYMPTTVYRPAYASSLVTAYQPVVAGYPVAAYRPVVASYPLTTYRPILGTYQTRLVPYTTYQPYNAYYRPAIAYAPVFRCSPCAGSPCGGGSPCGSGCGSVMYGAPAASGCSSCGGSSPSVVVSSPSEQQNIPAADANGPRKTFESNKPAEENAIKPAAVPPQAEPAIKPIPAPENTGKQSSMPQPALPDPSNRTASRTVYSASRVQLTGHAVEQRAPIKDDGGWQSAED